MTQVPRCGFVDPQNGRPCGRPCRVGTTVTTILSPPVSDAEEDRYVYPICEAHMEQMRVGCVVFAEWAQRLQDEPDDETERYAIAPLAREVN